MTSKLGFLEILAGVFELGGTPLRSLAIAWARVGPSVAIVPAFGLRAIPGSARVMLGLALAASIAPALPPLTADSRPFALVLFAEAAKGLPIALVAAAALWAATMTGGLVDNLRGGREAARIPALEPDSTPLGVLFGLLVSITFLKSGGPARVAALAADATLGFRAPLTDAVHQLTRGIELAVVVAAPVVAASLVLEVMSALIARAASPASVQQLVSPLRSLLLLAAAALLLERMLVILGSFAAHAP